MTMVSRVTEQVAREQLKPVAEVITRWVRQDSSPVDPGAGSSKNRFSRRGMYTKLCREPVVTNNATPAKVGMLIHASA